MADGAVARSLYLEKNAEAEQWRGVARVLAEHIVAKTEVDNPEQEVEEWLVWAAHSWKVGLPHG